jgi:L-lactate dehydrogenase
VDRIRYTICGIGHIGSAISFGLVLLENNFQLDLIDIDKKKLIGEIADLEQAVEVLHKNIKIESVEEPRESDYYIICCGKSGSDRESLYEHNKEIILPYLETIARIRKEDSWILMVTNPSGRLSQLALEYNPLIIPIGNKIDNARLRLFKVISRHETPEIQDKYKEVAINKGFTQWGVTAEVISYIRNTNVNKYE